MTKETKEMLMNVFSTRPFVLKRGSPLSYKYMTSVDVYESIHHKIHYKLDLNVYHIFLNNISLIFFTARSPAF